MAVDTIEEFEGALDGKPVFLDLLRVETAQSWADEDDEPCALITFIGNINASLALQIPLDQFVRRWKLAKQSAA